MTHPADRAADRAGDRGMVLVFVAMLMVALLIVVAIVIDLGYLRGSATVDQRVADLAALAAGEELGLGDAEAACHDSVNSLNMNAPGMPTIDAGPFCASLDDTVCSGGALAQAAPVTTAGQYTISIEHPVPDATIADPTFGAGSNDGEPCERMRVIVTSQEPSFFGGVAGRSNYTTTRTATVRPVTTHSGNIPAFWLLEPFGCTVLELNGSGTTVTVGDLDASPVQPGFVQVDSDGSGPGCSNTSTTISSSGKLQALPTDGLGDQGTIALHALPENATDCDQSTACKQSEIESKKISPQPVPAPTRATRAPVDWRWNCKSGYPDHLGVEIEDCPFKDGEAYIDQLVSAIGSSGKPGGFKQWTTESGHSCNISGSVVVTGNWWVDCAMQVSAGNSVTFADGNVVFDAGLKTTGSGRVAINTANSDTSAPDKTCTIPCKATSEAAVAYVRNGDIDIKSPFVAQNTMIYMHTSSILKMTAGTEPEWTAPTAGPFEDLALWGEADSPSFSVNGGATVKLRGTFFTPFANAMSLAGGVNWGSQDAQFISRALKVSGGTEINLRPSDNLVAVPPRFGVLIR